MDITLPTIELRPYQCPFWQAMEAGARRAAMVWPRRAGKDTVSLQWTAWDAHLHIGNYWHLFPEQTQARKAIWHGVNRDGQKILDLAFPPEIRERTNDSEMYIQFKCGSTWQLGGSDRYDALVGSNPRGIVLSEYAISNPRAYEFVRPILAENGGWALFPYTPRGRNHGHDLFERLRADPKSYAELLTCDDTGHMTEEALGLERKEMSEELFLQEYYGSWDFGQEGAIYARQMNRAMTEGRIVAVPYDESRPVFVSWDIGLRDSTALWFFQVMPGGQPNFIDYYEARGEQLKHYADYLRSKPYTYGNDLFLPHDAAHERLGARSVEAQLRDMGFGVRVLPLERSITPGIEASRVMINKACFDEELTRQGRACLSAYRYEYDDKASRFKDRPVHDWASDGADSYRYAVQAINLGWTELAWSNQANVIDYSSMDRGLADYG